MSDKILAEFNHNWADECDVHGLAIMTPKQYNKLIAWAKDCTWNFGSNEGWEGDDISDGFTIRSEEPNVIALFEKTISFYEFGNFKTWGNFPDPDDLYEPDLD